MTLIGFGLFFSATYISIVLFFFWQKIIEIDKLQLNEVGDFLAGVFGPLSIFWIILGFVNQSRELSLQLKEFKRSIDEQSKQTESIEKQLQIRLQQVEQDHLEKSIVAFSQSCSDILRIARALSRREQAMIDLRMGDLVAPAQALLEFKQEVSTVKNTSISKLKSRASSGDAYWASSIELAKTSLAEIDSSHIGSQYKYQRSVISDYLDSAINTTFTGWVKNLEIIEVRKVEVEKQKY